MISDLANPHAGHVNTDSSTGCEEDSVTLPPYCFNFDGKPAFAVAFVNASTVVLASSKVTTASAFSRLTSAFVTPPTFVNDLFTEITHPAQVIAETASVTVFISAYAAVVNSAAAVQHAASNFNGFILEVLIKITERRRGN